jgi:hypothetical protein
MNEPNYEELYNLLLVENIKLKEENKILLEHLKTYTAPKRNKKYYENHKETIIQKVKEYNKKNIDTLKKPSPEKIKEYSKRAYEKKKLKLLEQNKEINI